MELRSFTMPSHPPARGPKQGFERDLHEFRWCDELGYKESWIGEHQGSLWPRP